MQRSIYQFYLPAKKGGLFDASTKSPNQSFLSQLYPNSDHSAAQLYFLLSTSPKPDIQQLFRLFRCSLQRRRCYLLSISTKATSNSRLEGAAQSRLGPDLLAGLRSRDKKKLLCVKVFRRQYTLAFHQQDYTRYRQSRPILVLVAMATTAALGDGEIAESDSIQFTSCWACATVFEYQLLTSSSIKITVGIPPVGIEYKAVSHVWGTHSGASMRCINCKTGYLPRLRSTTSFRRMMDGVRPGSRGAPSGQTVSPSITAAASIP